MKLRGEFFMAARCYPVLRLGVSCGRACLVWFLTKRIVMEVMPGSGGGFGSRLVFELVGGAVGGGDVVALAEIHRLVDRAAFSEAM